MCNLYNYQWRPSSTQVFLILKLVLTNNQLLFKHNIRVLSETETDLDRAKGFPITMEFLYSPLQNLFGSDMVKGSCCPKAHGTCCVHQGIIAKNWLIGCKITLHCKFLSIVTWRMTRNVLSSFLLVGESITQGLERKGVKPFAPC